MRNVVVQTSANLTEMASQGQWNQAQVLHSAAVYDDFYAIFRQCALGRPGRAALPRAQLSATSSNYFFPRPACHGGPGPGDAASSTGSTATGATGGGTRAAPRSGSSSTPSTATAGVWIAKKLRYLWEAGCDVAIIYSVASRPVLSILRNRSGRGPIPMRQSVVKDAWGNIVKYNHSKWMTITGHWGTARRRRT